MCTAIQEHNLNIRVKISRLRCTKTPQSFGLWLNIYSLYRSNANLLRNGNEFIINNKDKAGHLNKFFSFNLWFGCKSLALLS